MVREEKICETCERRNVDSPNKICWKYLGEAVGWQWWPQAEENTCNQWIERHGLIRK